MTPLEQYPSARRVVYLAFWVVGLVVGALAVYLAVATNEPTPGWIKGAQAVLAFLAVPIGYTAAANVVDKTKIAAVQPADAPAGELVAGPAAVDVPVDAPVDVVPTEYQPKHADPADTPPADPAELQAYLEQVAADEGIGDTRGGD